MKNQEKVKQFLYVVAFSILALAIIILIIDGLAHKENKSNKEATNQMPQITPIVTSVVVTKEVEKTVEVEKKITSSVLEEGLKKMGVLITQEYFFTMTEDYESTKTILKFITSESRFIYSYDGTITAGIDFNKVSVSKNDDDKTIKIILPKPEIQSTDIDFNSFKLYVEKEGLWNPITLEDQNASLIELKDKSIARAKERGIIEKADAEAKVIIENFVGSFVDLSEYKINYVVK